MFSMFSKLFNVFSRWFPIFNAFQYFSTFLIIFQCFCKLVNAFRSFSKVVQRILFQIICFRQKSPGLWPEACQSFYSLWQIGCILPRRARAALGQCTSRLLGPPRDPQIFASIFSNRFFDAFLSPVAPQLGSPKLPKSIKHRCQDAKILPK